MALSCWLGLSHDMEWQPHIASVPTDRPWIHNTELSSPGLAPADWQGVFRKWWLFCCHQIRVSTTADSLFKPEPWPTSVERHPHLASSATAPLCASIICVVPQELGDSLPMSSISHLVQKHCVFPLWGEHIFKVWLAQRTSALSWITAQTSSRDLTKKQNLDWCWLIFFYFLPLRVVKEEPIIQSSETYWGNPARKKKYR